MDMSNEKYRREKFTAFLKNIEVLDDLKKLAGDENFFDFLNIAQTEILHSNALAWLLDPKKTKDVGKYFLRKLFILMMDREKDFKATDLIFDDFDNVEVLREWQHTDLLIVLRKKKKVNFVFCIENKVKSKQGKNQLKRYREVITSQEDFKEAVEKNRVAYLFLRVKDESPADEQWTIIDYNDIGTILKDIQSHCPMNQELNFFITRYLSTLRRYSMMDDQDMQELAQKIYSEHKDVLDYIYENVQNEDALKFKHYHTWIDGFDHEHKLAFKQKKVASLQFATEDLYKKIFPSFKPDDIGTYQQCCYYQIIKKSMSKIQLVFRNAPKTPDEIKQRLNEIRQKFTKNSNSWEWYSAKTQTIKMPDDFDNTNIDEELKKNLNKALLTLENKVFEELDK